MDTLINISRNWKTIRDLDWLSLEENTDLINKICIFSCFQHNYTLKYIPHKYQTEKLLRFTMRKKLPQYGCHQTGFGVVGDWEMPSNCDYCNKISTNKNECYCECLNGTLRYYIKDDLLELFDSFFNKPISHSATLERDMAECETEDDVIKNTEEHYSGCLKKIPKHLVTFDFCKKLIITTGVNSAEVNSTLECWNFEHEESNKLKAYMVMCCDYCTLRSPNLINSVEGLCVG